MPSTTPPIGHHITSEPIIAKSSTKRKGTRSVSTLTPSQLARKRANDREAQRAIRARTKEHIERLERELEELRCFRNQDRDRTVQDLLCRNKALEDEIGRLRDNVSGMQSLASSPYSAPANYDDNIAATPMTGPTSMPSPPRMMSPLPGSVEFSPGHDYSHPHHHHHHHHHHQQQQQRSQHHHQQQQHYVDSWASNVHSTVSSPSMSGEDYVSGYIPTSVPSTMIPTSNNIDSIDDFRINNLPMSTVPSSAPAYMSPQQQPAQQPSAHGSPQPQQQRSSHPSDWPVYNMYYNSQISKGSEACLSR